jgi:crotonobetainyl-CoA:carnitine CoA-transferase CaiB-like acyl-CoA transferase
MPPAPGIGEHGRAILEEFGLDEIAIGRLAAEGVLLLPGAP